MFRVSEKADLNQISITGLRAIILIGLLVIKPRTIDEIKQAFINFGVIENSLSLDTLRIDLNTIKLMGCKILRPSKATEYKYILTKHPFDIKVNKNEIAVLRKIYNKVKEKADLTELLAYDEFFRKISNYIFDEKNKDEILGISTLKYYNLDIIEQLILDCKQNYILEIVYKTPITKTERKKEIIAQKIEVRNNKVYLFCYDLNRKETLMLNLLRIVDIVTRRANNDEVQQEFFKTKFLIKNIDVVDLEKREVIVDSTDNGYIVEAEYYNNFVATQRVLSFGSKCTVLEPVEFRKHIIKKIKETRKKYVC